MAAEERNPTAEEILASLGVDDASCEMLRSISGELLYLRDTRVAACEDPRIDSSSEPDGYVTLASIAKVLAVNGPAREPVQAPVRLSDTLAELLDSETRQLLLDALGYLDYVIGWCESTAQDLSAADPATGDFVLVDETRAVVLTLTVQGVRVAREIRHLLIGGFPDAAWARWRTLHELAATAAFMVDSQDPDMPTRYLARSSALKRRLGEAFRDHGFLTEEEEGAGTQSAGNSSPSDRDDHSWIAGPNEEKHQKGFRGLEEKAGLAAYRPFYVLANSAIHADAVSLYNTIPSGGGPLINGSVPSGFYLPVHLALRSLRILASSVLLGGACRDGSERVVSLMDYFRAVVCVKELASHCEEMFGQYDDRLDD